MQAGFPGGVPAVETPDRQFMWDSTAMIHHLETKFPEASVLPSDPTLRFLCYLIEDYSDEWLYRPAVGTRWHFPENRAVAGYELARDVSAQMPIPCDQALQLVGAHVLSSCEPLGVNASNIDRWVAEVLRPWLRVLGGRLDQCAYLFGARPSLADFALFGGNAAHFINDPVCRRWVEEDASSVIGHSHRLMEPEDQEFGDWDESASAVDGLLPLVREVGHLYLPWVSRACAAGEAEIEWSTGERTLIATTPFLREARGVLLARFLELRTERLDQLLAAAGVLEFFVDYVSQATAIPDDAAPPRPVLNRPFPPAGV